METMRVVEIQESFGLDRLAVAERPRPEPAPGQVVLRMRAASLNARDLMTVRGHYNPKQPLPLIPCSDGVGEVVGVGEGVDRVRPGDRVAATFAQGWISGEPTWEMLRSTLGGPLDGTLAEFMALDAEAVVRVPEHLTDEEAATLPCAGLTAWSALVTHGQIGRDDTVLVQGTGGVSIFALQFAKLHGAHVTLLSSRDDKLERARALGADVTINYRTTPKWGAEVRDLYDGEGADHVVEVGGEGTLPQSLRGIRTGGTISLIGVLSGPALNVPLGPVVTRQIRLQGVTVGNRDGFEAMARAIGQHRLAPAVDRVFAFEELHQAFEHLASGAHFGKICLRH